MLAIEILKVLLQKNDYLTTSRIHEILCSRGILEDCSPSGSDRRKLNRVLQILESEGYVESKYSEVRGRKPQKWRANTRAVPYLTSLSEEELVSLLTLISFIPESYKRLSIFKPTLELMSRLRKDIDSEKRERIEHSFSYESQFLERFVEFDNTNLKLIHSAILEGKGLIVRYKDSNQFKFFPIKVFVYNGILYVGGIDSNNDYRTYHVAGLKILQNIEETISRYERKKYENVNFLFSDEKPFVFGVRIAPKGGLDYFSEPQIFPTQFHFEREKGDYLIYLVGFTGSRFVSRFLVEEVIEILPPSRSILNRAKKVKLRQDFPGLSFGRENEKRFKNFIEELEEFMKQRITALENLKSKFIG